MIDFVTLFMKLSFWDVTCSSFNPDDFRKFRDKRRAASSMFLLESFCLTNHLLTLCFELRPCDRRDAGECSTARNCGCLCAFHLRTRVKAKSCAVFSLFVHAFRRRYSPGGLG